ncbi:spike base protein, RCAP_Rcc01079 family [Pseudogemmobacter faecipullorum]|uniref:Uncharacterized protein n=1 Tax=Pseudogemmobacter faecipullorum TaxID=2755041 RepID=A0ABS8CSL6_9RHOB|nr:hypothetical protein [Pseudogemmobacter faecipullorum]MCB5411770.1 hypothetical protein [Pseudogemmobacter faecipullorum]
MSDPFRSHAVGRTAPGMRHRTITPSDTIDLAVSGERPRVIMCQAAGSVALVDDAGTVISYTMAAGQILPFSPRRINATGTTAIVVGWW